MPFRIPHSALRTRAGISLLEVLISIFIMAVGLLSIASLLPVGGYHVQKGTIEDRKATVGQNAFNEFRARGMSDAQKWIHYLKLNPPGPALVNAGGTLDTELAKHLPLSLAIDPLCLNSANVNTGGPASKLFPRQPQGATTDDGKPRMVRVGLSFVPAYEVAEQIFVSHDDTVFERGATPEAPAISKWQPDATNPNKAIRRQYEGNFSWLVTLSPAYFDSLLPASTTQYNVSIAIFFKRNVNSRVTAEGVELERLVDLSSKPADLAGFGLGGGELVLQGASNTAAAVNEANMAVKPGQWVMVCGQYRLTQKDRVPYFRWYRVTTTGAYDTSNNQRPISLAGPDWAGVTDLSDPAKWKCIPSHVAIFEGCVGVFEKTVHLEGPSMWSN